MKNNLRRMLKLLSLFDEDAFYACEYGGSYVRLQGWYTADRAAQLIKLKFNVSVTTSGYIAFERNKYRVVLTPEK